MQDEGEPSVAPGRVAMQTVSYPGTAFDPEGECPATGEAHSYFSDFDHYQRTGETGLFICECGARPSPEWLDNYDPTPVDDGRQWPQADNE